MSREHHHYVYLLTNWNDKVMYVGMTNDLLRRVHDHKTKAVKGFTEKYNVHKLVYFEETSDVHAAIAREKEIKKWRREKKNALVNNSNPSWRDLAVDIGLPPVSSPAGGNDKAELERVAEEALARPVRERENEPTIQVSVEDLPDSGDGSGEADAKAEEMRGEYRVVPNPLGCHSEPCPECSEGACEKSERSEGPYEKS